MDTLKAGSLKGRAVVSLNQAEKLGTVATLIFDLATSTVPGIRVKTGLLGAGKWLRASDIRSVGPDAVTITDSSLLHDHEGEVPELKDLPALDELVDMKIVSHSGALLGTLSDIEIDIESYRVLRYEMGGGLWSHLTGAKKTFGALPGLRFGKDLIVVPDDVAAELTGDSTTSTEAPAPPDQRAVAFRPATGTSEAARLVISPDHPLPPDKSGLPPLTSG